MSYHDSMHKPLTSSLIASHKLDHRSCRKLAAVSPWAPNYYKADRNTTASNLLKTLKGPELWLEVLPRCLNLGHRPL